MLDAEVQTRVSQVSRQTHINRSVPNSHVVKYREAWTGCCEHFGSPFPIEGGLLTDNGSSGQWYRRSGKGWRGRDHKHGVMKEGHSLKIYIHSGVIRTQSVNQARMGNHWEESQRVLHRTWPPFRQEWEADCRF